MRDLTPEEIARGKELIRRICDKPKSPSTLQPIYDDIYFQGLAFLNEGESAPIDISGTLTLDKG